VLAKRAGTACYLCHRIPVSVIVFEEALDSSKITDKLPIRKQ